MLFTSSHWDASERLRILAGRARPISLPHFGIDDSKQTKPVTFRVWAGSGGMGGAPGHLVGYFDAPIGKPKVFEFVDHVEPHTGLSDSALRPGRAPVKSTRSAPTNGPGPGLAVQWVEIEGPLNDAWPPESHRRIFGDLQASEIVDQLRRPLRGRFARTRRPMPSGSCATLPAGHFAARCSDDDIRPYRRAGRGEAGAEAVVRAGRALRAAGDHGLAAIFLFFHENTVPASRGRRQDRQPARRTTAARRRGCRSMISPWPIGFRISSGARCPMTN